MAKKTKRYQCIQKKIIAKRKQLHHYKTSIKWF